MKAIIYTIIFLPLISFSQTYEYDYSIREKKDSAGNFVTNAVDEYPGNFTYKNDTLTITSYFNNSKTGLKCQKLNDSTYFFENLFLITIRKEYLEMQYKLDTTKTLW